MEYLNKKLNDIKGEIWVAASGLEGIYEVSSFGRVKCLERQIIRRDNKIMTFPERIVSQCKTKHIFKNEDGTNGVSKAYSLYVRLTIDRNVCKNYSVGGLILNSFKKPDKYNDKTHHINLISHDNRLENLAFEDLSTSRKIQFDKGIRNGEKNIKHLRKNGILEKRMADFFEKVLPFKPNPRKGFRYEKRNQRPITILFISKKEVLSFTSVKNAFEQTGIKEQSLRNAIARPHKNRKIMVKYGVYNISDFSLSFKFF